MELFAELDANGIVLIVGAIFFGVQQVFAMWLASKREERAEERDRAASVERKAVAVKLEASTVEHNDKLDAVTATVNKTQEDVRKVELATNSMKDALIVATEKEALARGIKEGKESESARRELPPV